MSLNKRKVVSIVDIYHLHCSKAKWPSFGTVLTGPPFNERLFLNRRFYLIFIAREEENREAMNLFLMASTKITILLVIDMN